MNDEKTASCRTVRVDLGERSYDIVIGRDLIARAAELIRPHLSTERVFVITDSNVESLHLKRLEAALHGAGLTVNAQVCSPGEGAKSFANLETVLDALMGRGADRKDVVIALGGGVVGDLTGLTAGLLKRGMKFIQMPTTLLAQVDSSVGGKTAVNSKLGKNLIGLFNQPELVIADLDTLSTLPKRELIAGLAEVIKYGLIDDPDFFDFVEANAQRLLAGDIETLADAVEASCKAKARIVAEDETEQDKRALLNLGHTFAHALERANGFGSDLLHGEAVGCGMAMAFRYSQGLGLCNGQDVDRTERALQALGLETDVRKLAGGPYEATALLEHMTHDKKASQGRLTLVLAKGIGQSFIQKDADAGQLLAFLKTETQA